MNKQKVAANFSWQSHSSSNQGPHRFWVRKLPRWHSLQFNVHYSTIPLILWRSASWGTAVHHLGIAEPPSLPGICSVPQFSSKSPWKNAHGLKPKSLSASHRGPELQPQRRIGSLKQKVGFLQEFLGKTGSAKGQSSQMEGRNKHRMNGARTSGSLMSSAREPQRLRRGRAPLAANDKNKRLRVRCQRGSPIPGHPDTPLAFRTEAGGPRPGTALHQQPHPISQLRQQPQHPTMGHFHWDWDPHFLQHLSEPLLWFLPTPRGSKSTSQNPALTTDI